MDRKPAPRPVGRSQEMGVQLAQRLFEERQLRNEFLQTSELFGEPAWDILLYIFLSQSKGKGAKVESLAVASRLPVTLAIRWLERLEYEEMIFAYRDEDETGEIFLRLTQETSSSISKYLQRLALMEQEKAEL